MGLLSPMALFALWPLDGSVSTQTTSSRRGSFFKKKPVGPANIAADQEVVIISSTLQTQMDLFSVFSAADKNT